MTYKMSTQFTLRAIILLILLPIGSAFAGPYSDALAKRLVASTTPAEKAVLVRWMFAAMSLHPSLKDLTSVTPEQREEANKAFAQLVFRLLTESCVVEAREAYKYEGSQAIGSAFQVLGQVAARDLMTNPNVTAGLAGLDKLIDSRALEKALTEDPGKSDEPKSGAAH